MNKKKSTSKKSVTIKGNAQAVAHAADEAAKIAGYGIESVIDSV